MPVTVTDQENQEGWGLTSLNPSLPFSTPLSRFPSNSHHYLSRFLEVDGWPDLWVSWRSSPRFPALLFYPHYLLYNEEKRIPPGWHQTFGALSILAHHPDYFKQKNWIVRAGIEQTSVCLFHSLKDHAWITKTCRIRFISQLVEATEITCLDESTKCGPKTAPC